MNNSHTDPTKLVKKKIMFFVTLILHEFVNIGNYRNIILFNFLPILL